MEERIFRDEKSNVSDVCESLCKHLFEVLMILVPSRENGKLCCYPVFRNFFSQRAASKAEQFHYILSCFASRAQVVVLVLVLGMVRPITCWEYLPKPPHNFGNTRN